MPPQTAEFDKHHAEINRSFVVRMSINCHLKEMWGQTQASLVESTDTHGRNHNRRARRIPARNGLWASRIVARTTSSISGSRGSAEKKLQSIFRMILPPCSRRAAIAFFSPASRCNSDSIRLGTYKAWKSDLRFSAELRHWVTRWGSLA